MGRRSDLAALSALLVLGLAYQLCLLREGIGLIDEGHLANAARRLAQGEVLYRDVYTVYPPASFEIAARLFSIFGTNLFVTRVFHIALTLVLAVTTFAAGRRLMPPAFAWLAGALVAMTGWPVIYEGCHYAHLYGAVPMAALALLARADAQGPLSRSTLLQVGALAGLALAFRLEPFVGVALAAGVVVFAREGWSTGAVRALAWLVVGTLAVVVPIGVWYAAHGALGELLRAVFWTSFGQYLAGGEFNLPMPAFEAWPSEWTRRGLRRTFISWEFRIPVLLYGVAIAEGVVAWGRARRAGSPEPIGAATLARVSLALFGSVLYLRATGRSDYYHLAPILYPAYLLGADGLARAWSRFVPERSRAFAPVFVLGVLLASLGLHEFDRAIERVRSGADEVEVVPGGPRIEREHTLDDLIRDVRSRTRPGEPIVVLPWYPIVYFLAERPNPTRYDWLFPGYLTTDAAVSSFIEAIERSRVTTVVYSPISIDGLPDRSLAAFAPAIDRFLRERFAPVRRFGRFWVMTRRAGPEGRARGGA